MKKLLIMFVLITTAFMQHSIAQDSSKTQLLTTYYTLKEALVNSNATSAATAAEALVTVINSTDQQTLNDVARAALIKEASAISQSKDIKLQREKFSSLSNEMFELAKAVKLSADPIYQQYCPMKKASWLSKDKAIKNPYYGSAMLTCGSVKTIL